jgi:DNA-directed RNA polymerase specialized sigma24 family protein
MTNAQDKVAAMSQLPAAYSLALRLREAGLPAVQIAECIGIEPEAVGPLLTLAQAKLAAILHRQATDE